MGHMLKHRAKDDKWRLYTTISEGWLTDWLTADEMKRELAEQYSSEARLKVIEAYWTFPHGYYDQATHKRLTNFPAMVEFTDWHLQALKGDDYYGAVFSKYKELTGKEQ
jgi:hypothetical protein